MDVRDDLMRSLLAGLDRNSQQGVLTRMAEARDEQLLAKRSAPADLGTPAG
jgi:hypothetical protein